ncbi:MAG: hypothetical protein AAFN10_05650 [Bacteroidota bacterium]
MKEKDALEQFIEDKLAEKQFSYQASYWDQAAGQMAAWEAEAKRKRRFLWFSLLSGVLFIGLAITGIYAFTLRGTLDSQLADLNANPTVILAQAAPECDSSLNRLILKEDATERSPKVATSSPLLSNRSRPSTTQQVPNRRATNTKDQPQKPNTPPLSSTNLSAFANQNAQALTTQIERSAQQEKTINKLQKILSRDYRIQALLNGAFSDQAEADQDRFSSFNFYLQTGAGFSASNQQGESGRSLQAGQSTASFGIRYNIRPGLALESGLQYHNKRLDELSLSLSGRQFDFVAREQTIRWQVEQLHWLSVPLQLSLRPLKRHEFVLGGSVDWLATSRGTLSQSQQDPFNPATTSDLNGNGIVYGLRTLNYSAQLGYRFYLHPRMALDMRYRYGFRNLLDEEIWTAEAPRFDRQFQVGLLFYLK